ncbi:sugar phosphate isomerase/epimerase [Microlunatus panaciterrae]|uniref:D-psicose/D-tagatose/L-ribulose 3-epimerase n=1 Tax=Microlunatus panaciterrae TaxID=400768 RepID=A0ABS2RLC8_9ACTN|nr:sugar phosphate isomerase/epimerase [Microlunatus panaciterrae]MBM7799473.1 D-psicose/D-tagatose/L-ribulose 3-epimerase [Microlunatus panaciterrae]
MTTAAEATSLADRLPIAVNTFVWHSPVNDVLLAETLDKLSRWGYDGVEIACEDVGDWDPGRAGELLQSLGLRSVVGAVFGPGRELACAEASVIEATQDYVRAVIDIAERQGAPMVIGPMYTSVGRTWRMSADERRAALEQLRESLAPLCDYAGARGVRLAVEPLNRYETSLLTTAEQVMELIDPLPAETIGVNLDTYHMNIEEKSFRDAFDVVGARLLHLQVCGNDRGAPGEDHLDWEDIRSCLQRIGYRGMLGFESFTADNASIATAASIWRPFAPTQDELAQRALTHLTAWRAGWT